MSLVLVDERRLMSAGTDNADLGEDAAIEVNEQINLDQWADMLGIGAKAVLTTSETASILRVSEKSVRQGIKDGSIPSLRLGRRLLVPVPMLLSSLLREPQDNELHR